MEKDVLWQSMSALRRQMGAFIRKNSSMDELNWIFQLFELPQKSTAGCFLRDENGALIKKRVTPREYASVKELPAAFVGELDKWGEQADIILLAKLLKRPIICVSETIGTVYCPEDRGFEVSFLFI